VDVDESSRSGEAPRPYLERIAALKLEAVQRHLAQSQTEIRVAALLVADTIVVVDGAIVGKPDGVEAAEATLHRLVGRTHTVLTRYLIASASADSGQSLLGRTVETSVKMRAVSAEVVRRYAQTGEGLDKAGAYAVQGIGAFLVEALDGSYTNVVGLPACELVGDLESCGQLEGFPLSGVLTGFDSTRRSGG
jgi:septum formation protein